MSTIVYLSNREVKAVTGTVKNGRITVTGTYSALAPDESIINGRVINEETFRAFLTQFWTERGLPDKDVILVLGISSVVSRVLQMPRMTHQELIEYLPREFSAAEEIKDPMFGYAILNQDGSMMEVSAAMIDRAILEPHMRRFQEMGIRLSSVVTSAIAGIMSLGCLSYMRDKTCIVQELNGVNLVNTLYVDGHYYQSSSSRVFGQRGTTGFAIECARSISNMQQFLKTRDSEVSVSHVYLGDGYQEEDVELTRESILQMDDSLVVEKLYEEEGGAVSFQTGNGLPFEQAATLVGALLVPKGKNNLLYQYRQDRETVQRRKARLKYLIPGAALAVVLAGIAIIQAVFWFASTEVVNQQFDYLGDQSVIAHAAEYDRLEQENAELEKRIAVMNRTMDAVHSYPVYRGEVKRAVLECARGLATAEIAGFDGETGVVSINALSQDEEGAHRFVDELETRTDVFRSVYYEGFQYDEKSGLWKAEVECYLTVSAADQREVAP